MSFFDSMNISATALTAQRLRMDIISENIANVDTTRSADGGPYRRKTPIFQEILSSYLSTSSEKNLKGGVRVLSIEKENTPGARRYEPAHPDADADGYVIMPNVNIVTEMVDMISASRSYEASITAINNTKAMISKTFEIGR